MIQIKQDNYSVGGVEQSILKNNSFDVCINTDLLDSDISKLTEKARFPLSKYDKSNIKRAINYLSRLKEASFDSKVYITWSLDGYILRSTPIKFIHIPEYSIEMTDYIVPDTEGMIRVEYTDMIKIIAIEMMYRDLGETFQSMEHKLSDIGITSVVNCYELLKYFDEDVYMLSKSLKIGDSPYRSSDGKISTEYFGRVEFNTGRYRECVEYSIQHALTIIFGKLAEGFNENNIHFKVYSISDSGIYISVDKRDKAKEILDECVVVRAFGRQFMVSPKITVF